MTIEDLVKEGKIRPFQATAAEIKRSLEVAHRTWLKLKNYSRRKAWTGVL